MLAGCNFADESDPRRIECHGREAELMWFLHEIPPGWSWLHPYPQISH
jgi:hypothetical protein